MKEVDGLLTFLSLTHSFPTFYHPPPSHLSFHLLALRFVLTLIQKKNLALASCRHPSIPCMGVPSLGDHHNRQRYRASKQTSHPH